MNNIVWPDNPFKKPVTNVVSMTTDEYAAAYGISRSHARKTLEQMVVDGAAKRVVVHKANARRTVNIVYTFERKMT